MKEKIVKRLYGFTAFVIVCLMIWEQGLCEAGTMTRGQFVTCFIVQAAALVWSLVQCGFYGSGNDKK